MSGSFRPNILKRKNTNFHRNAKEKEAALSQNILENSEYYQKLINMRNDNTKTGTALKSNCQEEARVPRVKRKRKNSPTSQKCNIDLDDVARADREARLANKNQAILEEQHPDSTSISTSHSKPMFSDVEFLDENVWNIESWDDEPTEPPIEETNYPRTVHDYFEWNTIKEINSEQTRRDIFTGQPGPVTEFATPYDAFTAIWNQNVLEDILKTTNKRGKDLDKANRESDEKNNKTKEPWIDITITELYVYLAIVMSTAGCTKLKFSAHFRMISDISGTPFYAKYMNYMRFHRINQAFCFIDEDSLQETELNKYEKNILAINPLVNILNERFSSLYNLHQNIVIEKIKSVNINDQFRKFERLVGLIDSSTGYCWQFNYIIDEVPKYTSLLQRYAESQCRNDEISLSNNLPDQPTVYVKSFKQRKISEKEFKCNNNKTMPKSTKNKPITLNKNCDPNTAAINNPKRSKHDSTNKPIGTETNEENLQTSKSTSVSLNKTCDPNTTATPKRSKHYSNNKPIGTKNKRINADKLQNKATSLTFNKNWDLNTTAINNDPETSEYDSTVKPIGDEQNADKLKTSKTTPKSKADKLKTSKSTPKLNADKLKTSKASSIQLNNIEISEKLQHEILYDEDLPPLSRPIPCTVLQFVKNLHFKGHTLFMDWSFQSLPLARTLKSLGIDCVGSFRANTQHTPKDLKLYMDGKLKLVPGQVIGYTSEDIDIILWNERRILTLISTYHGLATIGETNLQSAVDYNFAMSVVDRFHKNMKSLSFNSFGTRKLRVYVWSILKISLINAYILYQNSNIKRINLLEFVEHVVKGILDRHGNAKVERIVVNVSSNLRDHLPIPCKKPWPRCGFCIKDDKEVCECVGCKIYLCVKCFTKYHETIAARIVSK